MKTIFSQMAAMLSALRTGRTFIPRNIIMFLFLVPISVRPDHTSVVLTDLATHVSSSVLAQLVIIPDRLCGLVVRVLDYRCRGPGFDSRALQKKKKSSGSGTGSTQPPEYN
jgi:hypothetical protein